MSDQDPVAAYLTRLAAASAGLPDAVQRELLADVEAHLHEVRHRDASEASLRQALDDLGAPETVAAAARSELLPPDDVSAGADIPAMATGPAGTAMADPGSGRPAAEDAAAAGTGTGTGRGTDGSVAAAAAGAATVTTRRSSRAAAAQDAPRATREVWGFALSVPLLFVAVIVARSLSTFVSPILAGALPLGVLLSGWILVWTSRRWSPGERVLATLLWPGGLLIPFLMLTMPTAACTVGADGIEQCTGTTLGPMIGVPLLVLSILVPIGLTVYLLRRAGQVARRHHGTATAGVPGFPDRPVGTYEQAP